MTPQQKDFNRVNEPYAKKKPVISPNMKPSRKPVTHARLAKSMKNSKLC